MFHIIMSNYAEHAELRIVRDSSLLPAWTPPRELDSKGKRASETWPSTSSHNLLMLPNAALMFTPALSRCSTVVLNNFVSRRISQKKYLGQRAMSPRTSFRAVWPSIFGFASGMESLWTALSWTNGFLDPRSGMKHFLVARQFLAWHLQNTPTCPVTLAILATTGSYKHDLTISDRPTTEDSKIKSRCVICAKILLCKVINLAWVRSAAISSQLRALKLIEYDRPMHNAEVSCALG